MERSTAICLLSRHFRGAELQAAAVDTATLLRFRITTMPSAWLGLGLGILVTLTAGFSMAPMLLDKARLGLPNSTVEDWLPTALFGAFGLALVIAISTGGGRELLPREQAVFLPLRPATDHFGALLFAPINIAWLMQLWVLLAAAAYLATGSTGGASFGGHLVAVLWMALVTTWAQAVAWCGEIVRRLARTRWLMPVLSLILGLVFIGLVSSGAQQGWAITQLTAAAIAQPDLRWGVSVGLLGGILLGALAGILPAAVVAQLPPREETRLASRRYRARPFLPLGLMLMAIDWASAWRSLPIRRGLLTLIVLPIGGMWVLQPTVSSLLIIPSLVASGAALLFAVNAWCLDGSGLLWRESLPINPQLQFWARSLFVLTLVGGGCLVTVFATMYSVGQPTPRGWLAMGMIVVVCALQVTATVMWWSGRRPHRSDLTTARATPAPPSAMLAYSAKLAVATTVTSLVLAILGLALRLYLVPFALAPFLLWSGIRWWLAYRHWADPAARSRVISIITS